MRDGNWRLCHSHIPGHRGCVAISVQKALKRKGYPTSQYQGTINTGAPDHLVRKLSEATEAKVVGHG